MPTIFIFLSHFVRGDFMKTQKMMTQILALGLFGIAAMHSIESNAVTDQIGSKKVALPGGSSEALITVRKTELVLGHPFTIEVRANCKAGTSLPLEQLPVLQARNVCDVKPASAKLSSDGKSILITIRETDSEKFNEATNKAEGAELAKLRPECKTEASQLTIPLESLCNK